MTDIEMVAVHYRGAGPALPDLIGGRVQVTFESIPSAIQQVRAGKLRALAVTTTARSEALPDVPTVAESVPGYDASGWHGIVAPPGTPPGVVNKLNAEIAAILADPGLRARIVDMGGVPLGGSPADFGKFIASETAKWAKVIRAANIKAE